MDIKYKSKKGLSEQIIRDISKRKDEPEWMLELRLKGLEYFLKQPLQKWGPDLTGLDFDDVHFYASSVEKTATSWDDVPKDVRDTFVKLGVPEAERQHLAGLGAQHESEVVYHNLQKEWADKGVIFLGIEEGLKQHPEIFKKYFGSVVPYADNKFAALNTAAWSGGSFVYVPKNVKLTVPLQTYFRIDSEKMGQFERTLIIADENSHVTYVEGCTAPSFSSKSLHSAVVEIIANKGARVRYTTIQNWAKNIYNLVTKRAMAHEDSLVEWIDGNFGSYVTMKYPCVVLKEPGARTEIISIASACTNGQTHDSGAKAIHLAPNTSSRIVSKSISANGGRSSYRGLVKILKGATGCKSSVVCDALILDGKSRSDTYPTTDIFEEAEISHEARVSQIEEAQLFYLTSRGIKPTDAESMVVSGFIEPFVKELPMEFALEMNRLVELEMEGSVG
jgi:Fe-S cluster assembly protein SufB